MPNETAQRPCEAVDMTTKGARLLQATETEELKRSQWARQGGRVNYFVQPGRIRVRVHGCRRPVPRLTRRALHKQCESYSLPPDVITCLFVAVDGAPRTSPRCAVFSLSDMTRWMVRTSNASVCFLPSRRRNSAAPWRRIEGSGGAASAIAINAHLPAQAPPGSQHSCRP